MSNSWQFQKKPAGEFDGFKDAGIEYFTGSPYSSLAREVIQNSLDARLPDPSMPARVYFDLVRVPKDDFPGRLDLEATLSQCLALGNKLDDGQAEAFFEAAIEVISCSAIPCLRMADTGTTGLRGPCWLSTPYFAFMKARGQSLKSSSVAGGSYGIGKNAPFALSDLRTIFVSTNYADSEGQRVDLAQGKAILMSQPGEDGEEYLSATGYFGEREGCLPIQPPGAIPEWLRRRYQFDEGDLQGTSVFVTGFRPKRGWQGLLIASVISNYFEAIYSTNLEVVVDDGNFCVNRANLITWFDRAEVCEAAKTEDVVDQLELARAMSECLFDDQAKEENSQLRNLGHCRVQILVREGLAKKVGVVRNGMLVTSQLRRLLQFPGYSDFVALVSCLDPSGNELLRRMENPEHNNFEPERLRDPDEIFRGRKALDALARFVRDSLKKHARVERGQVTELDELAEFFQDPDKEDVIPGGPGETDLEASVTVLAQPQKRSSSPAIRGEGVDDGDEGGGGGGSGSGGSGGGRQENGSGGHATRKSRPLKDVRTVVIDPTRRDIFLTPEFSGLVDLTIQEMGADAYYKLAIRSAEGTDVEDGIIKRLIVRRGHRTHVRVEFTKAFRGALRVVAYEV